MNATIRPEQAGDEAAISAVTEAAFSASPHGLNGESRIVEALREAGALTLSLVAEGSAGLVGHVALSPVRISDGTEGWLGLGPLSVAPGSQRRGIGARLVTEALDASRARGAAGCVLVGEPEYYGRFGFENVPGLVYPAAPTRYFQALGFGASFPVGTVSYHAAFAAGG